MGRATSDLAVTSVKIERRKLEALRQIAERDRRNVSQQIRWLIDRCVDENEARVEEAA